MLEEDFFAQFAVPLVHILIQHILKTFGVLGAVRECRAQVMYHIFDFGVLGSIEIASLLHFRKGPVFRECMQVASGIDQAQASSLLSAQSCCQDLRYSSTEAMSHEDDVGEIEVLQEIRQHICMAPDGGICRPGMFRLTVAEHIESIDRSPKSGELRNDGLPDEGSCRDIVQQHDSSICSMLCALNNIADIVVNRMCYAPL